MKSSKSKSNNSIRLSTLTRFYLAGLHGILLDVCYIALLETWTKKELKLMGSASILSIPVFGGAYLLLEYLSLSFRRHGVPFYIRGLIYTILIFIYEFATGYFLLILGHPAWDYSIYPYNFKGVITLEFTPIWFVLSLLTETLFIDNFRKLAVIDIN